MYDYIIVGTGAGGSGALFGLLEKEPTASILVLERGADNAEYTPCGLGHYPWRPGTSATAVANKQAVYLQGKSVQNVAVVEGNTTGGNTVNNVGLWGHQPLQVMKEHPPFNHAAFDETKWTHATDRATASLFLETCDPAFNNNPYSASLLGAGATAFRDAGYSDLTYASDFATFQGLDANSYTVSPGGETTYLVRPTQGLFQTDGFAYLPPFQRIVNHYNISMDSLDSKRSVLTLAEVDRVVFAENKARGVQLTDGRIFLASKHIFLAAGALSSPTILAKSGISPSSWGTARNPQMEHTGRFEHIGKIWQNPDFGVMLVPIKTDTPNTAGEQTFTITTGFDEALNLQGFKWSNTEEYPWRWDKAVNSVLASAEAFSGLPAFAPFGIANEIGDLDATFEKFNIVNAGLMSEFAETPFAADPFSALTLPPAITGLMQGRQTVDSYPHGYIKPNTPSNPNIHDLTVDFNWEQVSEQVILQAATEASKAMIQVLRDLVSKNMTFSSADEIVAYGVANNRPDYIRASSYIYFPATTVVDGTTILTNVDFNNVTALAAGVKASGWHYVGTTGMAHDPDTLELASGLTVSDCSAHTTPSQMNTMASCVAIGYYAADVISST